MRVLLLYIKEKKILYQAIMYELTQLTTFPVVLSWSYLPMTDLTFLMYPASWKVECTCFIWSYKRLGVEYSLKILLSSFNLSVTTSLVYSVV
jgi:hypothetical protein